MEQYNKRRGIRGLRALVMLCIAILFASGLSAAQAATVKGKVISEQDNAPVIGATVIVDGTTIGASTNFDGEFEINNAPESGKFTVSYLGLESVTESIISGKVYSISLAANNQVIDEVVVVGYGTMRKKEVTGSVARVESEQLTKMSTPDVGTALQGQIAGVNVQASSGAPGSTANIQIRGVSSVNGSNQPLYVVDGVPFSGDPGLSPNEIASIDVLKDAASAAIYGTRGAGGVILITTKTGSKGATKVSLDAYYGIQKITSSIDMLDATDEVYLQTVMNDCETGFNNTYFSFSERATTYLNDTDIIGLIEEDNQPVYNVSLSVSGGSDNVTYSVVANYFDQEGVVINSGFDRLNVRANTTFKKKKWTLTANLTTKIENTEKEANQLYQTIYKFKSTSKNFDPTMDLGNWDESEDGNLSSMANSLAKFKEGTTIEGRGYTGNFMVGYKILPGLDFSSRIGTGYNVKNEHYMKPLFEMYDADGNLYSSTATRSELKETNRVNTNFSWEQVLSYGKKWGDHDLKATAAFSAERYTYDTYYVQRYDLISNDIYGLGTATGEIKTDSGTNTETSILGMLARAQYNYKGKYMASASIRRDGSSRFTKDNRWGYFPSVSAGWLISEEPFWKKMSKTVNGFKVRASFGTTGNQNFNDYEAYAIMEPGYDYSFPGINGENVSLGTSQKEFANSDVKWETTQQLNAGIDLLFFKSKLSLTADVYKSSKKDMLFQLKVPLSSGSYGAPIILNVGDMTNQGVELALGYNDRKGDFSYGVTATFARNVNEITKMAGTNKEVVLGQIQGASQKYDATYLREGYEAGAYFLRPKNGIINTDQKLREYQKLVPTATMGDLIYVDSNGDGSISDADRVYYGCGAPNAEIGLNGNVSWKGIDFSMSWYASLGNEIINGSKLASYQYIKNKDLLYSWSPANPFSTIPALKKSTNASHDNTNGSSDRWVEDGTFLRLRNIVLGYTLPKKWMSKLNIAKFRVYVAADNIWTITKYEGYDPEVGNDGLKTRGLDAANYPVTAQIRGGIQVDF